MFSTLTLVCDSSSVANFKQWAQAISSFFSSAGWQQASDTGQVNWTTISAVPGSSAFVYEIWEPNDGLANFYAKIEYGNNQSNSNSPCIRVSIGTGTNGAGTLTGLSMGPIYACNGASTNYTAPSSTTQYNCHFSAAAGRFGALMWRDGANNCQQYFAIERSVDVNGNYTGAYVTVIAGGLNGSNDWPCHQQQSLVFGVGPGPTVPRASGGGNNFFPCLAVRRLNTGGATSAFNGAIPFDTVAPDVGYYDNNCTMIGVAAAPDVVEGVTFTVTLYGATRTYMPTKNGYLSFGLFQNGGITNAYCAICMRYD